MVPRSGLHGQRKKNALRVEVYDQLVYHGHTSIAHCILSIIDLSLGFSLSWAKHRDVLRNRSVRDRNAMFMCRVLSGHVQLCIVGVL